MSSKQTQSPVTEPSAEPAQPALPPLVPERPGRFADVPPVTAKTPHRRYLPDGQHWVDIIGGGSNVERIWFYSVQRRLSAMPSGPETETAGMEIYATFIADRVAAHNLTTPGGDPLPLGLDLAWELGWEDTSKLVRLIQEPPSLFSDPKAGATSSGGSPPIGSSNGQAEPSPDRQLAGKAGPTT